MNQLVCPYCASTETHRPEQSSKMEAVRMCDECGYLGAEGMFRSNAV